MQYVDVDVFVFGFGEVIIKQYVIGLNYIDVYFCIGLYLQLLLGGIGMEVLGVVEVVGEGVMYVKFGDCVVYVGCFIGVYVVVCIMLVDIFVCLLDVIDFEIGVVMMLQGMIVQYLFCDSYCVQFGDMVLFYVVVGGVGLIVCQWLKVFGVMVIGIVGSDVKVEFVCVYGCDYIIVYMCENFIECVCEIIGGKGVLVVYDGIGKDMFMGLLDCFVLCGMMVIYGNVLGFVLLVDFSVLSVKGLFKIMCLMLMIYMVWCELLELMVVELFDVVSSGKVKIEIYQCYELQNVVQVYCDLEVCKMIGLMIFLL